MELLANGYKEIHIKTVLSPAWTTDWMTEEGKMKLKEYGIALQIQNNMYANRNCLQMKWCNVHIADLIKLERSASLAQQLVRLYTSAGNVRNPLTILNVTNQYGIYCTADQ
jgi:metal-sulfur cluster biosynthetic enzyme